MLLMLSLCIPKVAIADKSPTPPTIASQITPENTIILANAQDARFSRDFSILLNQ